MFSRPDPIQVKELPKTEELAKQIHDADVVSFMIGISDGSGTDTLATLSANELRAVLAHLEKFEK